MGANNRYKDSVFSLLFGTPAVLRELYSALSGVTIPPETPVTINTLEDALFMDRVNDISFTLADRQVILIEHQSTINPNMAIRLLLYAARIYEKILGDRNMYTTKLLKIPRPSFFVLYNGAASFPDEETLRLSDSFADGFTDEKKPALELEVRVININEGRNIEIACKCRTLAEYSLFVAKVREFGREGLGIDSAVRKAVRYCRDNAVMKEFLELHASEVLNMLCGEWNWDTAREVWQEEAYERGLAANAERVRYEQERVRQGQILLQQEQERVRQEQERNRQEREHNRQLEERNRQERERVKQLEEEIRRLREQAGR